MKKLLNSYWRDQSGATAIEYGLIATLVCSALIAAMSNYGNNLGNTWNKISSKMS